jgi:molybdate transport system ATP-binding protein
MSLEARMRLGIGSFELDVDLKVEPGELVAVLGPNGAGKTSLLRGLAGLLPLAAGRVILDGVVLDQPASGIFVPSERRPIAMVFQDYLLFPHLSVLENIAFGLRSRGTSRAEATATARRWLERVGLAAEGDRRPASLSGGQAQRVALARALATNPALLLLDEPMAALDASTRVELRRDLRRHLGSFRGVRLLVTHDPVEAMVMADRLVILEQGKVLQSGSPAEVTQHPRSRYVADLVGVNLFRGRASNDVITIAGGGSLKAAGALDGDVFAVVHPRTVALYRTRPDGTPRNVWQGRAVDLDFEGDRVRVRLEGTPAIVAEVTPAAVRELSLDRGDPVWVAVKATEVDVYPA